MTSIQDVVKIWFADGPQAAEAALDEVDIDGKRMEAARIVLRGGDDIRERLADLGIDDYDPLPCVE